MSEKTNVVQTELKAAEETREQKEFIQLLDKPVSSPLWLEPEKDNHLWLWCERMSKSMLVPKDFRGNPANIYVAVQWGLELGLAAMQAMQNISVINGRPALWGDAMLALVRGSGLLEVFEETYDEASKTAYCRVKRKGFKEHTSSFSMADADKAKLTQKQDTPWQNYPRRMCQMRARSWALRDQFTDILRGVREVNEARDIAEADPMENALGLPAPEVALTFEDKIALIRACRTRKDLNDETLLAHMATLNDAERTKAGEVYREVRECIMALEHFRPEHLQEQWDSVTRIAENDGREAAVIAAQGIGAEKLGGEQVLAQWVEMINYWCKLHQEVAKK